MKNFKSLGRLSLCTLSLLLALGSCKKDDIEPVNQPPTAPVLLTPKAGEELTDPSKIDFTWGESADAEGDAVVYDLYLKNSNEEKFKLLKSNIATNSFDYAEKLSPNEYQWKVVAKNPSITDSKSQSKVKMFIIKSPNLSVSKKDLMLEVGSTATITILSGTKSYTISSSDDFKAVASVSDNIITVEGKLDGKVQLTLTDSESNESLVIEVRIIPQGLEIAGSVLLSVDNAKIPSDGHIAIPDFITKIGHLAFRNCVSLTTVDIPNSVTSIGEQAFQGCKNLTSIEIPNSVTSIGESAFMNCSSLTSVTIPNSVTSISIGMFYSCKNLTSIEIPSSVTSIGDYAFGFTGLTSIEIPNSVTSIGEFTFYACRNLTSITIPNSVTSIGDGAFEGCSNLTSVVCKAVTPPSIENGYLGYTGMLIVPQGAKTNYEQAEGWKSCDPIVEE